MGWEELYCCNLCGEILKDFEIVYCKECEEQRRKNYGANNSKRGKRNQRDVAVF